MVYSYKNKT